MHVLLRSVHTPRYLPCGALTHVTLKFELEYDNAPHGMANHAEYELTFTQVDVVLVINTFRLQYKYI